MTDIIWIGALASLLAGLMTGVGALPVLARWHVAERARDAMLGFAAGVMLSASFFSLILPGIEAAGDLYGGIAGPAFIAAGGIALGAVFVAALNEFLPHEHFIAGREGVDTAALAKIWLFVIAITIHNFPEGLAVGVGFGGGDIGNGLPLAIGIGLQNAPEGLAVALALVGFGYTRTFSFLVALGNGLPLAIGIGLQNAPEGLAVALALVGFGYTRTFSFLVALGTGLIEPVGGLIGVVAVNASEVLLPWGLTFAAGAMLYIISHEIIPETHRRGHQNAATTGLIAGLILMMLLDVTLG